MQAKLVIDLEKFRLNLTHESGRICAALQELYIKSCENEEKDFSNFIRRAYQLSIIGIVWTEALKVPLVQCQCTYELKDYLQLSEVPDVWNQLDEQTGIRCGFGCQRPLKQRKAKQAYSTTRI